MRLKLKRHSYLHRRVSFLPHPELYTWGRTITQGSKMKNNPKTRIKNGKEPI